MLRLGLLAGVAVIVVALTSESAPVRGPQGEWIGSVRSDTAEIWAVGDADPPDAGRVARLIRRADPDRILYLGDVYPKGSPEDFERWAKPWRGLVRRMAPTPGNHEWPESREGYEPYWQSVTGEKPPTYYSFDAGGWQILSINSEHSGAQRPTENWLESKTRSGGNCRLAFWHRPRYSAGKHRDGGKLAEEYWEAIAGKARAVVNGHDHNMQRFRQRDGIVEFVSGAGGRNPYAVDEDAARLEFSNDTRFGALRLRLSPGRLRWAFVAAGGAKLDSGSLGCRT